ncbi:MAG: protein tyrosine phosphatase family protein [bacterium]
MQPLTDILNFVQLTPNVGTSGQPLAHQFQQIADAGYKTVINLAMADSDNAVANEGNLVAAAGMSYIHLPVDFAAPTAEHAQRFAGLMQVVESEPVFVHCAMNLRVSAFMYLYLRHVKGYDEAAATSPMIEKWAPRMDTVWRNFLQLPASDILS